MAEAAPVQPPAARPTRGRSIAAAVCLVLAAVLTVPASFAYWGQRTINDGSRYVATVGPLVDAPEVQAAITTKVTDAIQTQVDVEALLNQAFAGVIQDRPRLQLLVGPLAGAVNGLIESQVRSFIASDAFREFWIAANTRVQERLVQLLKGETSGAVSVQGGQVVLDVSDVIDQVKQQLVDRGLTFVQNAPTLPGPEPADRAARLTAAQAGAHDLRLQQPGREVADRGRRPALPGRTAPVASPAADHGDHRRRARRERAARRYCCCRSAGSCSSTSSPAPCSAPRAGSSTTLSSPTSSEASG